MNNNVCKLCNLVQITSEKRRKSLEDELEKTKKLLDLSREQGLKIRMDFLRETTSLREVIEGKSN